jgi:hypothetical protein
MDHKHPCLPLATRDGRVPLIARPSLNNNYFLAQFYNAVGRIVTFAEA